MAKTNVKTIKVESVVPYDFYEIGSYFTYQTGENKDDEIVLQLIRSEVGTFMLIVPATGNRWLDSEGYDGRAISRSQLINHLENGSGIPSSLKHLPNVIIQIPE